MNSKRFDVFFDKKLFIKRLYRLSFVFAWFVFEEESWQMWVVFILDSSILLEKKSSESKESTSNIKNQVMEKLEMEKPFAFSLF